MPAEHHNPSNGHTFTARAVRIGDHVNLRAVPAKDRLGNGPVAVPIEGGGVAVLLRYGVVVLFDTDPDTGQRYLDTLRHLVRNPAEQEESEDRERHCCLLAAEGDGPPSIQTALERRREHEGNREVAAR